MPDITITLQSHVFVIIGLTIVIILGLIFVNRKLVNSDPLEKPKGIVLISLTIVEMIDNMIKENTSSKYVKGLGPYIGTLAIYILLSNYIGLLGFDAPTANYSVTLALALVTWIMIQATGIRFSGVKGYIKGFFEPFALFFIPNFFGKIAPLISMSLRLFGNLLAGSILMGLVYTATGALSNILIGWIPVIGQFNVIGPLVASVLHAYFDVFSGAIQMFIFIMLTMCLIGNEIPEESK